MSRPNSSLVLSMEWDNSWIIGESIPEMLDQIMGGILMEIQISRKADLISGWTKINELIIPELKRRWEALFRDNDNSGSPLPDIKLQNILFISWWNEIFTSHMTESEISKYQTLSNEKDKIIFMLIVGLGIFILFAHSSHHVNQLLNGLSNTDYWSDPKRRKKFMTMMKESTPKKRLLLQKLAQRKKKKQQSSISNKTSDTATAAAAAAAAQLLTEETTVSTKTTKNTKKKKKKKKEKKSETNVSDAISTEAPSSDN